LEGRGGTTEKKTFQDTKEAEYRKSVLVVFKCGGNARLGSAAGGKRAYSKGKKPGGVGANSTTKKNTGRER